MIYAEQTEGPPKRFLPWQPSTWPEPDTDPLLFWVDLELIFEETILVEIENVISDAQKCNGGLEHRGHVIVLSLLCAVDVLSSYAYADQEGDRCDTCGRGDSVGPRYKKFIETFFPEAYKPFASDIYKLFRNSVVHSWNLFEAGMWPGHEAIEKREGVLIFGLLDFFKALEESVKTFATNFETDTTLQQNVLRRYRELRATAKL